MATMEPGVFDILLPLAVAWAQEHEHLILSSGVRLTVPQLADAVHAGVQHPERVRILQVDAVPQPDDLALRLAALKAGLLMNFAAGLTLGYGIYMRASEWDNPGLLVHELAHVQQYERLGGIEGFLRQYLWQCLTDGYCFADLEQEAVSKAASRPTLL